MEPRQASRMSIFLVLKFSSEVQEVIANRQTTFEHVIDDYWLCLNALSPWFQQIRYFFFIWKTMFVYLYSLLKISPHECGHIWDHVKKYTIQQQVQ